MPLVAGWAGTGACPTAEVGWRTAGAAWAGAEACPTSGGRAGTEACSTSAARGGRARRGVRFPGVFDLRDMAAAYNAGPVWSMCGARGGGTRGGDRSAGGGQRRCGGTPAPRRSPARPSVGPPGGKQKKRRGVGLTANQGLEVPGNRRAPSGRRGHATGGRRERAAQVFWRSTADTGVGRYIHGAGRHARPREGAGRYIGLRAARTLGLWASAPVRLCACGERYLAALPSRPRRLSSTFMKLMNES